MNELWMLPLRTGINLVVWHHLLQTGDSWQVQTGQINTVVPAVQEPLALSFLHVYVYKQAEQDIACITIWRPLAALVQSKAYMFSLRHTEMKVKIFCRARLKARVVSLVLDYCLKICLRTERKLQPVKKTNTFTLLMCRIPRFLDKVMYCYDNMSLNLLHRVLSYTHISTHAYICAHIFTSFEVCVCVCWRGLCLRSAHMNRAGPCAVDSCLLWKAKNKKKP